MNKLPSNLEEIYQTYAPAVQRYLEFLTGDSALADDLTSETFYQAMLSLDSFAGRSSLKTWLLRIAYHLYLRQARHHRRNVSLEQLIEQGVRFSDPATGPETALSRAEDAAALSAALNALDAEDRALLLLWAQGEYSGQELAELLDVSLTAAKVRLHRARRRLAATLEKS